MSKRKPRRWSHDRICLFMSHQIWCLILRVGTFFFSIPMRKVNHSHFFSGLNELIDSNSNPVDPNCVSLSNYLDTLMSGCFCYYLKMLVNVMTRTTWCRPSQTSPKTHKCGCPLWGGKEGCSVKGLFFFIKKQGRRLLSKNLTVKEVLRNASETAMGKSILWLWQNISKHSII